MKRFMVALVAVIFLVGFNSFAFADEKAGGGEMKGEKHDEMKGEKHDEMKGEMKGEMKAGDKGMEKKEAKKAKKEKK